MMNDIKTQVKAICLLFPPMIFGLLYTLSKLSSNNGHVHVPTPKEDFRDNSKDTSHFEIGFTDPGNKKLVEYVRKNWIFPPSHVVPKMKEPINHHFSQEGQSKYIDKLLKGKTNGFFIECGANNGKTLSNSLYFERYRNWTGLLIEPGLRAFKKLFRLKRNAYSANVLLCPNNTTNKIQFADAKDLAGITEYVQLRPKKLNSSKKYYVQCFTVYTLLLAVGVTRVDYFSLDVEGTELLILKTIPFDNVYIKTFTIEYKHYDGKFEDKSKSEKKLNDIRNFFKRFPFYKELDVFSLDVIYERID